MDFLCFDFVNSQWYNTHDPYYEPLKEEGWFLEFCRKWGLDINIKLSAERSTQLISFREFLFDLIVDIDTNKNIRDTYLKELNRYLALIPLNQSLQQVENGYKIVWVPVRRMDSGQACMADLESTRKADSKTVPMADPEPSHRDLDYIRYKISASLSEILSGKEIGRISICDNPACRWVFLDSSKNQTRKWCSNTCSSLIKVRHFRERRKKLQEDTK